MSGQYAASQDSTATCASATHRQILLVGKDQEGSIAKLVLVQHALELLASLNNTIAIVAVDNEDDTLGVLEVMPPQRTDLVLTTDIPHGEGDVLVLDSLDVEPWMTSVSRAKLDGGLYSEKVTIFGSCRVDVPMVGMVVTISPSFSL